MWETKYFMSWTWKIALAFLGRFFSRQASCKEDKFTPRGPMPSLMANRLKVLYISILVHDYYMQFIMLYGGTPVKSCPYERTIPDDRPLFNSTLQYIIILKWTPHATALLWL